MLASSKGSQNMRLCCILSPFSMCDCAERAHGAGVCAGGRPFFTMMEQYHSIATVSNASCINGLIRDTNMVP